MGSVLRVGRHTAVLVVCVLPLLAACGDSDSDSDDNTPLPTSTQTGVATPAATNTSIPSTPTPTNTVSPTHTLAPPNTPAPSNTQRPTNTPTSTAAPTSTSTTVPATPTPTNTLAAADTPTPTGTAAPETSTPTLTSTPEGTVTPTPEGEEVDLTDAIPAAFNAHGSVEQVWVTGAVTGTVLELVSPARRIVQSGTADAQGTLLFREVAAADGYVVITRGGTDIELSNEVIVRTADDAPDQSFYDAQEIKGGYGYLAVRDGTKLAINVLIPGEIDGGPYPTVVEYSGYDPANPDASQPSSLISFYLGYAVVGVNMRGTGCSGGAFDFFETLQSTDGYDVIETIAAQPWVKGHKVGMVGISYPGISQLFVAKLQPPHLAAIAPLSVVADIGAGILYPGGILNNGFATSWAADRQHDALPYGQAWSAKRRNNGDQVCIANQLLRGQSADLMAKIRANPFYVPAIADPVSPATFVDRVTVPVFLAGAWQDEQTGGYFPTMIDRFTGTDNAHFTITNGNHSEALTPAVFSRWMEFLDLFVAERIPDRPPITRAVVNAVADEAFGISQRLLLEPERFTDVTTYEEAVARWKSEPKIRILFENGAASDPGIPGPTFELSFESWPIPSIVPTAWYLDNDGQLTSTPPIEEGADSFIYDAANGQRTTFHGGTNDVWKKLPAWDWRPLTEGNAVAYETEALAEPIVMAGSGSVDLWLMSTATDVDTQVTLSEIHADGKEVYVQSGWLRASHRFLDETRSTELRPIQTHREADAAPLPAGEFAAMRIELYPFGHVFHAGSRLRLAISAPGGDRPFWEFENLAPAGETVNTVAHSPARPSRIVLPVLPGVDVESDVPPCPSLRGQPCREYVAVENSPG